jgi:hypothetical protein
MAEGQRFGGFARQIRFARIFARLSVNQGKDPWTPDLLSLLGTMPDSERANRVGCIK